jgi:hypothetical protein
MHFCLSCAAVAGQLSKTGLFKLRDYVKQQKGHNFDEPFPAPRSKPAK